jgi:hypothetical protein
MKLLMNLKCVEELENLLLREGTLVEAQKRPKLDQKEYRGRQKLYQKRKRQRVFRHRQTKVPMMPLKVS